MKRAKRKTCNKIYIAMPLKKTISEGHKNWKLTKCPECGQECWITILALKFNSFSPDKAVLVCTECALKK